MDRKYLFDFIILFSDLLLKLVYHYARTTYSMCDLYREVKMPKPKVSGSKNKKRERVESLKKIEIWSLKNTVKSTQGWQKCWGADGWQQSASMESADCVT